MGFGDYQPFTVIGDPWGHSLMFQTLAMPAFVLLVITSTGILVSRDWRVVIAFFAAQFVGVLVLVGISWPFGLAAIKLIVGWMAGVVLGMTQLGIKKIALDENFWPANRVFRILAAGLVLIVLYTISPQVNSWLPAVDIWIVRGSLTLIGMGLLQLGMTSRPFRVIIGLMMVLSGFEILYSVVESSVLVAGLLAAVNFGLTLLGSYFLSISTPEELA